MIDEILNIKNDHYIFISNCLNSECPYVAQCYKYLEAGIDKDLMLDGCNNPKRHVDLPLHKKFSLECFYRFLRGIIKW